MFLKNSVFCLLLLLVLPSIANDSRIKVDFPAMMQEHMMANMRDHLLALQTITKQLSTNQFDAAADTAEQRLGMTSMKSHGASHMGKLMPKIMAKIGTEMHKSASRFARISRGAEVEGGLAKAFGALSEVMEQCVACHSAYKIH